MQSSKARKQRNPWAGVAVMAGAAALAVAVIACPRPVPPDQSVQEPWLDAHECPHYWSRLVMRGDTLAPLSGALLDVPEYNDCQRLLPARGNAYGTLAAVLASATLDQLPAEVVSQSAAAGKPMAVAGATILSISGPHNELGIRKGANCLYFWTVGAGWDARVVPVSGNGSACLMPLDPAPPTSSPDLDVHVMPLGSPGSPYVARWERDTDGGQAIGIRCGNAWCVVVRHGATPAADFTILTDGATDTWLAGLPRVTVAAPRGSDLQALSHMRGWLDDQRLARAAGGPDASPLWAAVMPHPRLDAMVPSDFHGWQASAYVWVPSQSGAGATLNEYEHKLNLHLGWNAISLCSTGCGAEAGALTCDTGGWDSSDELWYARIESQAGGTPQYFCVRRVPHAGSMHIVGATRWRWLRNDETAWMRCVDGCCEVQPKG